MIRCELCGIMRSFLGIAVHYQLGFCRALVAAMICGLLIAMVTGTILNICKWKKWGNKYVTVLTMILITCLCFFLSYLSIYRTPEIAFKAEFGFAKPESVVIEAMEIVPYETRYFSLMKISVPPVVVKEIIETLELEESIIFEEGDFENEQIRKAIISNLEKSFGFSRYSSPPEWWKLSSIKRPKYYRNIIDEYYHGWSQYHLVWDEENNTVYYEREAF